MLYKLNNLKNRHLTMGRRLRGHIDAESEDLSVMQKMSKGTETAFVIDYYYQDEYLH